MVDARGDVKCVRSQRLEITLLFLFYFLKKVDAHVETFTGERSGPWRVLAAVLMQLVVKIFFS